MHAYFPHKYHIPHNRFEVINQYYKSEPFCKIIEKEITMCMHLYIRTKEVRIVEFCFATAIVDL